MTKRELAIIMAYTDVTTLTGDDLKYLYDYLSEVVGRKIYTHEIAKAVSLYKNTIIKNDFAALCQSATND